MVALSDHSSPVSKSHRRSAWWVLLSQFTGAESRAMTGGAEDELTAAQARNARRARRRAAKRAEEQPPPHPATTGKGKSTEEQPPPHPATKGKRKSTEEQPPPHPATKGKRKSTEEQPPPHPATKGKGKSTEEQPPSHPATKGKGKSTEEQPPPHPATKGKGKSTEEQPPPHPATKGKGKGEPKSTAKGQGKAQVNHGNPGNFVLRNAHVARQPEDGNCLYHSLCFGLPDSDAQSLRCELAQFLRDHPLVTIAGNTLQEWIQYDSGLSIHAYASRQSNSGHWGGGIEMVLVWSRLEAHLVL
ncbi:unnamed protein product [Symbiodinium sp. CCMP2592]|nr:unnamed protein product [Symbiodinium sp. CCMP2592]